MIGARTARLAIEPMSACHAAALAAAVADPTPGARALWDEPATVDATLGRIAHLARGPSDPRQRWFNFVMRRLDDAVVIGRLEATVYDGWCEIAYLLGTAHQRQGFAREGVQWMLDQLAAAGFPEAWAAIHPENFGSIGLVRALGFVVGDPAVRSPASYEAGDVTFVRSSSHGK